MKGKDEELDDIIRSSSLFGMGDGYKLASNETMNVAVRYWKDGKTEIADVLKDLATCFEIKSKESNDRGRAVKGEQ